MVDRSIYYDAPNVALLIGEYPQEELALAVRQTGLGNDDVIAGR